MCEDGVCECTVWVCVCNHFHLCADTTPCVEANGCRLATPFLYVSLPFVLLPSRHISAAFTAPHPSLFLFLCPILSFYYLHHFDTPPPPPPPLWLTWGINFHIPLPFFPKSCSTDSPPASFTSPPPSPPLHPSSPTLQLLFWISQMAPVRSSDPFPLPPTELHCTVCLLPFLSPPRRVFPVHVHTNHTDVSDRCVSRCLCGQNREFAAVSFLSGPAKRDGAGIPLTPLNKKTKQKKVCCSKPDKKPNQGKFPTASLSGIHLTFQLLLDSSLSSFLQPTLFFFPFFFV